MKKILVVLLILSVAGGVFAQDGGWSLGASTWIGTRLDLDPNPGSGDPALVNSIGYFNPYHQWSDVRSNFNMGYSAGPLNVALLWQFRPGGNYVEGALNASGENYRFVSVVNLLRMFRNDVTNQIGDPRIHRLWGEYKMLNEMLNLVIAYKGPDTQYWYSDTTGGLFDDSVANNGFLNWAAAGGRGIYLFGQGNGVSGNGKTFTRVDGHNFIVADFGFSGLNFGLFMPNLFSDSYLSGTELQPWEGRTSAPRLEFVEDALKMSVFGVKFSMSPIEFAAQFRLADYGIYFGGKFFAGPVTAGFSFMGVLNDPNDSRMMKMGASVEYNAGAFGAGLKGWYHSDTPDMNNSVRYKSVIGIEPNFFYNVIPTHLRFELDAGFYFNTQYDGIIASPAADIFWAVQPQLFWNFRGTGAGSFWGMSTGIIGRYRVISDTVNAVDVIFKFAL